MVFPIRHIAKHLQRGQDGEHLAAQFLKQQGLNIIDINQCFHRIGELDIVAWDGEVLVFVEVRTRQAKSIVSAAESITPSKQHKWKRAAMAYLQQKFTQEIPPCRFDAVCIEVYSHEPHKISWLKGVM